MSFTLVTLCQASGAGLEQVQALVDEGLPQPVGQRPEEWHFGGDALPLTRRAPRPARDLGLGMPGVALVMDLLSEIDSLRARLRRR